MNTPLAAMAAGDNLAFEQLLVDISAGLINSPPDRVSEEIEKSMALVTRFLGEDACLLYEFVDNDSRINTTHLYLEDGKVRFRRTLPTGEYPYILGSLKNGVTVQFGAADDMPADATTDRIHARDTWVQSLIAIPIKSSGNAWYGLIVASAQKHMPWPPSLIPRLRLVGEVFANSLARKRTEQLLRTAWHDISCMKDKLEIENRYLQAEIKRCRRSRMR